MAAVTKIIANGKSFTSMEGVHEYCKSNNFKIEGQERITNRNKSFILVHLISEF
jgi:hypothetical protein